MIKLKLSVTNCYLIPLKNKYILIDTGYTHDKKRFFKELNKHNIDPKNISYLFLTHIHDDHVGLIHELLEINPSCKLILHKNGVNNVTSGINNLSASFYVNKRVSFFIGLFRRMFHGGFQPYQVRSTDILISEETSLKNLGIDLPGKILFTPGHTKDSISLILDNGFCFCGDAAANMLSFLGTKHCVIVLEDLNTYYSSWKKLLNEPIKTIFPGHGSSFSIDQLRLDQNKQYVENMRPAK